MCTIVVNIANESAPPTHYKLFRSTQFLGISLRSGTPINLDLSKLFWMNVTKQPVDFSLCMADYDYITFKYLTQLEQVTITSIANITTSSTITTIVCITNIASITTITTIVIITTISSVLSNL